MRSIQDIRPQLTANRTYWCGWAPTFPGSDLTLYRTDLGSRVLNGVLRVRDRPLDQAVAEAREQMTDVPWMWWVGEDSDPGTAEGLLGAGAIPVDVMPIVAVNVTTVVAPVVPAELMIWPVVEAAGVQNYVAAYAGRLGVEGGTGNGHRRPLLHRRRPRTASPRP